MEDTAITQQEEKQPRKGQYTQLSLQAKQEGIARIVKNRRALARDTRTDLHNLEEVKRICNEYENSCEANGLLPNFAGLCSCLGVCRSWAYRYIALHGDDPTAQYFDLIRTRWASMREDAMTTGCADTVASIFLLKNSGQGYSDRNELTVESRPADPRDSRPEWARTLSDEEYRQQLMRSIVDDEEGTGEDGEE